MIDIMCKTVDLFNVLTDEMWAKYVNQCLGLDMPKDIRRDMNNTRIKEYKGKRWYVLWK